MRHLTSGPQQPSVPIRLHVVAAPIAPLRQTGRGNRHAEYDPDVASTVRFRAGQQLAATGRLWLMSVSTAKESSHAYSVGSGQARSGYYHPTWFP